MQDDPNNKPAAPTEEAPAEPTEAPETPAEVPEPTPEPASEPTSAPTPEPEQKPKSKKPLIVTACVLAVLTIGVGGFFLYRYLNPSPAPAPETAKTDQESLPYIPETLEKLSIKGNDLSDFDLAFLKLNNKPENKIYSPLSIKYALAMLKDGAAGNSAAQIEALIGNYQPKAYLNSEHRSLANAMFIRDDFRDTVLDSYIESLEANYNAEVRLDPFTSPDPVNAWISDKTLGIINNMLNDDIVNTRRTYILINALAIDMNWENRLQCIYNNDDVPCKWYTARFAHEKYYDSVSAIFGEFDKFTFNGAEGHAADIGASANRYDIIKELGEDHIRTTVRAAYEEYATAIHEDRQECITIKHPDEPQYCIEELEDADTYLETYMSEIASNYGKTIESTDFYFSDNSTEKVFAKDLREYDGSTLQYVGIMPKSASLASYISDLDAAKTARLISNLKDASDIDTYKEGVVTKLSAHIPFFKFGYNLEDLTSNLQELGITDVFSTNDADLSKMLNADFASDNRPHIESVAHKADIEFTNDGIRAAAVTTVDGLGSGGDWDYLWDVPIEEIDLTFDKPFLFLIRDKSTGEVWFAGTVYEI